MNNQNPIESAETIKQWLSQLKVGDAVVREAFGGFADFIITEITDTQIICGRKYINKFNGNIYSSGEYTFDKITGAEIDTYNKCEVHSSFLKPNFQ